MLTELRKRGLGALEEPSRASSAASTFEGRRAAVIGALPGRPMSTLYSRRGHTANARPGARRLRSRPAHGSPSSSAQTAAGRAPVELDGGVVSRLRDRFGDDPNARRRSRSPDGDPRASSPQRGRPDRRPRRFLVRERARARRLRLGRRRLGGRIDVRRAGAGPRPLRAHVRALPRPPHAARPARRRPSRPACGRVGRRGRVRARRPGWFPTLFRRFLQDGLARLGADPAGWRDAALAGVAEVAALTDHHEFARLHLELFRRLTSQASA